MTLDRLREGDQIFLDANIFVYHFLGLSQQCKQLLKHRQDGFLQGRTASFILAETVHRLMIAEAVERKLVTAKNALKKLREKPEIVQQLSKHAEGVQKIKAMNIEMLRHVAFVFMLTEKQPPRKQSQTAKSGLRMARAILRGR